jgi:hypothetical protein
MKIGQHEQAWKPAREELETIDAGNEKIREKLKIWTMITPKEREEWVTSRLYRYFCLVLQGCAWFVYGTTSRRIQIG